MPECKPGDSGWVRVRPDWFPDYDAIREDVQRDKRLPVEGRPLATDAAWNRQMQRWRLSWFYEVQGAANHEPAWKRRRRS